MKKTILTLILTTALAATTEAQQVRTCEGGQEFQGAENGHYYCASSPLMTWWAAFAWCQKQGRHLASLDEACAGFMNATGGVACPNMKVAKTISGTSLSTSYKWTANPGSATTAYIVKSNSGSFTTIARFPPGYDLSQALCY